MSDVDQFCYCLTHQDKSHYGHECPECLQERIAQLESENAELIKFITACSEDRYARVACLEWVRKHKKCSKP